MNEHIVTLIQPGLNDIYGEPVEFDVLIKDLHEKDAQYVACLKELKAQYELQLSHLKLEFPDQQTTRKLYYNELRLNGYHKLYLPTTEYCLRYQNLCKSLEFATLDKQLEYINDHIDSDVAKSSRMVGREHYRDTIAKEQYENIQWVDRYLRDFLNRVVSLALNYQQAVMNCGQDSSEPSASSPLPELPTSPPAP